MSEGNIATPDSFRRRVRTYDSRAWARRGRGDPFVMTPDTADYDQGDGPMVSLTTDEKVIAAGGLARIERAIFPDVAEPTV